MSEKFNKPEDVRSDDVLNKIINDAIKEVVDLFGDQMTERDGYMLSSVIGEQSTSPIARIIYLRQIKDSAGVSSELINYVNQALETIKQGFNQQEINLCRAPFGGSLLTDIS